jgi:predicted acylesterase/phospholipase RssA
MQRVVSIGVTAAILSGCSTFAAFNRELAEPADAAPPARATFAVDGARGNPRVLMFLALSGGGSRAAYLSGATMLRLQTVFADVDLLREVDVLSAVSGGSLAAAFYALTRDVTLAHDAIAAAPPLAKLAVDADRRTLRCSAPLDLDEQWHVRRALAANQRLADAVIDLCTQAPLTRLREWNEAAVKAGMRRDYLLRWFGNWFWPANIGRYWFTAFDRSDIMSQTLADNLFDSPLVGTDFTFADLNPTRPYLILNATNATEQTVHDSPVPQGYAFGTVFTFTEQDFRDRLASDLSSYEVARAVMASSAFPLVFPTMTLEDFRPRRWCRERQETDSDLCRQRHFVHTFDGGNSDNLGLKSVRRALAQLAVDGRLAHYDAIVVLLVDAFTRPTGVARTDADPRTALSFLLDTNVVDAVDSLLQANRIHLIEEFRAAKLQIRRSDCDAETRALPAELCKRFARLYPRREIDLSDRMFFYHFGFDDVGALDPPLKEKLDRIPTSFRLGGDDARLIDAAIDRVLTPANDCLRQIRAIVLGEQPSVAAANRLCRDVDAVPTAAR